MAVKYLVSAEEMRKFDNYTIDEIGIPGMVLMERAALSVVNGMKTAIADLTMESMLVICGGGNNGGDGLAVARLLCDLNCKVDVVLVCSEDKCSEQTAQQLAIIKKYNQLYSNINLYINENMLPFSRCREYSIIVDAIFGVGLSRDIKGEYLKWIEAVNASDAYVVAVDVPSGINADDGRCMGVAVKADLTVTFAFAKRGLYLLPGKECAGKVLVADIGITDKSFNGRKPKCFTYSEVSLPARDTYGNKGSFGKLLVIAGSKDMCGACILCAKAAYRVGAGMVKIVTGEANRDIIQSTFPEAMLLTYGDEGYSEAELSASLNWADGVVVGPGMGQSDICGDILEYVLRNAGNTVILDADALNILSGRKDLQRLIKERKLRCPNSITVITPHQGELSRLIGKTIPQLKAEPVFNATETANMFDCIVVNKDAITVVGDANGEFYINTSGNCGMATAGSGDVLSGILGGIMVQKQNGYKNALQCVAECVYLHGYAGDLAAKRVGKHAMLAGDIIDSLKEISKEGL